MTSEIDGVDENAKYEFGSYGVNKFVVRDVDTSESVMMMQCTMWRSYLWATRRSTYTEQTNSTRKRLSPADLTLATNLN